MRTAGCRPLRRRTATSPGSVAAAREDGDDRAIVGRARVQPGGGVRQRARRPAACGCGRRVSATMPARAAVELEEVRPVGEPRSYSKLRTRTGPVGAAPRRHTRDAPAQARLSGRQGRRVPSAPAVPSRSPYCSACTMLVGRAGPRSGDVRPAESPAASAVRAATRARADRRGRSSWAEWCPCGQPVSGPLTDRSHKRNSTVLLRLEALVCRHFSRTALSRSRKGSGR